MEKLKKNFQKKKQNKLSSALPHSLAPLSDNGSLHSEVHREVDCDPRRH